MTPQIHKYPIAPGKFMPGLVILTPVNSTVLSVAMTPEGPCAWALVSNTALPATEPHHFLTTQTGMPLPEWIADARFMATLQYFSNGKGNAPPKMKIQHVFEITPQQAKLLHGE